MSSPAKEEAKKFIEATVKENQIVVFAKSWCKHCAKTKELLKKPEFENVSVKIFDMDQMPEGTPRGPAVQFVLAEMTGQKSVPNVWVNGEFLGGNEITQEKFEQGELLQQPLQTPNAADAS